MSKALKEPTPVANECQVCVNNFTKRNNPIQCPTCKFTACFQCYKQVILENPTTLARCMEPSCKKEFSPYFIHDNFQKTFLKKDYKEHLKEICFQKETVLLPETQDLIVRKEKHERRRNEIQQLLEEDPDNQHFQYLNIFYRELEMYDVYADETTEPQLITEEHECYKFADNYVEFGSIYGQEDISLITIPIFIFNYNKKHPDKEYSHQYQSKCPSTDCRGLLTSDYTCGICQTQVCRDCLTPISTTDPTAKEHTCNPETVETIKSISKETKPCPTCHVPIYKIDGCSQMWCVQCHTAFSWNTGEIETEIHNPHYYEWMFNQSKNNANGYTPPDNPFHQEEFEPLNLEERLNDLLVMTPPRLIRHFGSTTAYRVHESLKDKFEQLKHTTTSINININKEQLLKMSQLYYVLCQGVFHLMDVRFNELHKEKFGEKTNQLREDYLRSLITEEEFKTNIEKLYRINEYNRHIEQLIQLNYVEPVKIIFENYLYDITNKQIENLDQLQQIINTYNEQLITAVIETDNELDKCATVFDLYTYKLCSSENRVFLCKLKKNKPNLRKGVYLMDMFDF